MNDTNYSKKNDKSIFNEYYSYKKNQPKESSNDIYVV